MYVKYTSGMTASDPLRPPDQNTLSVELGSWFKARATGAGVIAIPLIVLVLGCVALARVWFG
jgi:hypothetical protein